jgi:glycosyltransferase involved in cell wall biosynthesis
MTRYARELFDALNSLGRPDPIALARPIERRYLSRLVDRPDTRRMDRAWERYVGYPRSLRHSAAGVHHILDHGYAHAIRYFDPARTVITCHDVIPLLAAEGMIPVHVPATVARTFKIRVRYLARARAVIVGSAVTKDTLQRHTSVRPDRITVIPYGISRAFRPMPGRREPSRASAGIDMRSPVVLQVASGGRYKNTPALLRAVASLRPRLPRLALVRIGAPLYDDEATLARQLGIAGIITFLGEVDDKTLVDWYNAADVLVFPSWWEGFGWPPLEAMACGMPVVGSTAPAIAEVTGDAAILVAPADPTALAQAIQRVLLDSAVAASLRQKGLRRASEYDWTRTAAATAAVYDHILQST